MRMMMRATAIGMLTTWLAWAQYSVGDKVEFNYHGESRQGIVLKADQYGFLIEHDTGFGMSQAYYQSNQIRPIVGVGRQPNIPLDNDPKPPPLVSGNGLMSQQDVLGFLRGQLGDNPWGPTRTQVMAELARQIKIRGLDYHHSATPSPYYTELSKFGLTSEVMRPLSDNFGPPPTREQLMGTWKTEVNAPAVYFTRGNELWRRNDQVQKLGSLTISPNGSYSWRLITGQVIQGGWRPATEAEMQTAGGQGVVLQRGKAGFDWIVTRYRGEAPKNMPPNWITIAEITTRQEREFGNR